MSASTERAAIEKVAEDMRRDGYEVRLEVPLEEIDPRFGRMRADLVAQNGEETVIVEVKSRQSAPRSSIDRLATIVDSLDSSIRLDVVWLGDDVEIPNSDDVLDLSSRAASLAHVEPSAAFLLAWASLEGALRVCARRQELDSIQGPARQLLADLYGNRIISFSLYDTLDQLGRQRNLLAHGISIDRSKKGGGLNPDDARYVAWIAAAISSEHFLPMGEASDLLWSRLKAQEIRELAFTRSWPESLAERVNSLLNGLYDYGSVQEIAQELVEDHHLGGLGKGDE